MEIDDVSKEKILAGKYASGLRPYSDFILDLGLRGLNLQEQIEKIERALDLPAGSIPYPSYKYFYYRHIYPMVKEKGGEIRSRKPKEKAGAKTETKSNREEKTKEEPKEKKRMDEKLMSDEFDYGNSKLSKYIK